MKTNDLITHFMMYHDQTTDKSRPLLVLAVSEKHVLVYKITSKYHTKSARIKARYYPILDWKTAGLIKQSYIDTYSAPQWIPIHKLTPIIGHLSDNDILAFNAFLKKRSLNDSNN